MIFNRLETPNRHNLVQEAYTWVGVPYVDGQHSKFGCDCVGFLIGVSKSLNYIDQSWEPEYYSPQWHLHEREEKLLKTLEDIGCEPKNLDDRLPGDILIFQFYNVSAHVGLFMPEDTIIHSLIHRGVVHHGLRMEWRARWLKCCWQLPGITDVF